MVTIKDVAKEAGVAISTVSNVLNGVPNISEEIRDRVLIATRKLKYRPNLNAKLLRSGSNKIIAVFLCTIQGQFYSKFIQAIQKQCEIEGYILQMFIINELNSKDAVKIMTGFGISGAIIFDEYISNEMIETLAYSNIPAVVCDREFTGVGISCYRMDNYGSSCDLMEYLISMGHTKIGYIHGNDGNSDNLDRYKAYCDVLEKNNIELDLDIILQANFEVLSAYNEISDYIKTEKVLPTAFFCANDEMAIGCMDALKNNNIKIPDTVSVVGYDDDFSSQYYEPKLTTVSTNPIALGHESVAEVVRLINNDDLIEGNKKFFDANVVIRNSVNKIN